jgi:ubiquinone/menaquinone biosynthesis C-methylase UbiE
MDIREAYDTWAEQYDRKKNKTRDLEGVILKKTLSSIDFDKCLEIGCGTGKNTAWLRTKSSHITAVDFSSKMLAVAKEKITSNEVKFIQADINNDWSFGKNCYDLVTFSLVLEHILDLEPIFDKVSKSLKKGGFVYIGELHPFKQYTGTKARFETTEGRQVLKCFTHHVSDFITAAKNHNFEIVDFSESFDENDRKGIPRILTLLLKKIKI